MSTRLKKDGNSRYIISSVGGSESFTFPKGFYVSKMFAYSGSTVTTTAPTISLGTTVPVNQVGTITVAGIAGVASTVFSIGGVASTTQIAVSNTVTQTMDLIKSVYGVGGAKYANLLNAGWRLTDYNYLTGAISFEGSPVKTSTAPVIVTTDLTVQTVVSAVTVTGVPGVDFMTAQSLATTANTVTDLTSSFVSGKNIIAPTGSDTKVYLNLSLNAIRNHSFYIVLQQFD
jgi:hypothetical protein